MPKQFTVPVVIATMDSQTGKEAADRLLRWFETFGHTASGHGFTLLGVGTATRTPRKKQKETPDAS